MCILAPRWHLVHRFRLASPWTVWPLMALTSLCSGLGLQRAGTSSLSHHAPVSFSRQVYLETKVWFLGCLLLNWDCVASLTVKKYLSVYVHCHICICIKLWAHSGTSSFVSHHFMLHCFSSGGKSSINYPQRILCFAQLQDTNNIIIDSYLYEKADLLCTVQYLYAYFVFL